MDTLSVMAAFFTPNILLMSVIGTLVGIVVGALPGLNTPVAIALVLPFVYTMDVIPSIALIMGVYIGGVAGGLITGILLRIPGEISSAVTMLDGYPLTLKGQAAEALSVATFVSFAGGIFSTILLMFIAPGLSRLALGFGPWEYFGTTFFALSLVCILMNGRIVKGYIGVLTGLLIASVGISPIDGLESRMSFGNIALSGGFSLMVVIIGLFAFSEIYFDAGEMGKDLKPAAFKKKIFYIPPMKEIVPYIKTMFISSILGTIIGILPGLGPSSAGMVSYAQAKRTSKHPEEYGHGSVEGLVAAQTSNNACTGGALVPMIALAIPGDMSTAVILGALMILGIQTGPLLIVQNPDLFKSIVVAVFVANILMLLIQSSTVRISAKLTEIKRYILLPAIVVFCVVGAISDNNRMFDVYALIFFGIVGYVLEQNDFPLLPIVLGYVLGPLVEENYRRSLMYYGSLQDAMITPSIGSLLFLFGIILPFLSVLLDSPKFKQWRISRKEAKTKANL